MPILSLNSGQTLPLDGAVAEVEVQVGQLLVVDHAQDPLAAKIVSAEADDEAPVVHDCGGSAGIVLQPISGCRVNVVYVLDVKEAPTREEIAARGDAGGSEGSFEARTVEELLELAQDRDIKGRSKMDKAELIAALRQDS